MTVRTPTFRYLLTLMGPLAAAGLIACSGNSTGSEPSGLPTCGTSTLLTVSPVPLSAIREIAPLGNLNPPGHTFPTDHIYFYLVSNAQGPLSTPVSSPGTIRVTSVLLQKRTGNGVPEFDDYGLDFSVCSGLRMYFGHVSTLTTSFAAQVGALGQSCDAPYQTGGFTFQQCRKDVDITLNAGDAIGTAGGPGQGALDLGAVDDRVSLSYLDPGRVTGAGGGHTGCPLDYFTADAQSAMVALVAANGVHRTDPPVCGVVMQDVANTVQGRWFFDATTNEDHHLALVHASWSAHLGAFSVGTQLAGASSGVYFFTPAQTGRVNLDFNLVTADGKLYCYQSSNDPSHTFYLQLETASRLRIQYNLLTTCADPTTWSFGGNSVTYSR